MQGPFWEEIYKDLDGAFLYNQGQPSVEIIDLASKLKPNSTILDIGCGDGRNAIFLAQKGFLVTAFDISVLGIKKLKHQAKKLNVQIDSFVQNMISYNFVHKFDLIITHGCLHLIPKKDSMRLLREIMDHTMENGYNVHAIFTDAIEPSEDMKPLCKGLFREGEIFEFYKDWKVIIQKSYVLEDEHPGGIKHKHPINKIVAKR